MTPRRSDWQWLLPILLALASLVGSAFIGYSHNDKAISSRISVVETKQEDDRKQLDRIESKVDDILKKMAGW